MKDADLAARELLLQGATVRIGAPAVDEGDNLFALPVEAIPGSALLRFFAHQ